MTTLGETEKTVPWQLATNMTNVENLNFVLVRIHLNVVSYNAIMKVCQGSFTENTFNEQVCFCIKKKKKKKTEDVIYSHPLYLHTILYKPDLFK